MVAAAASPARSRRVRWWFAVKFYRRDRLDVAHLLGQRVSPVADRWCLVWSDISRLAIEQKAQFGSQFGELLPRIFEAQRVSWGLGFHLESLTMFIYGLGSISGKNPRHNLDTDKVLLLNF